MRVHKPHNNFDQWVSESDRLLNVTCNDISVIYVTAHISAGRLRKRWDLRSGYNRHRHVVVSVQAPTQSFYGYSEKSPHFSRILRRAWGYAEPIVVLHPRVPTEELPAACEGKMEQELSPSLLNLVLFCFGVSFALFCVLALAVNISQTQVSKKTDPPLHVIQNIHTHVLEFKIAFAVL